MRLRIGTRGNRGKGTDPNWRKKAWGRLLALRAAPAPLNDANIVFLDGGNPELPDTELYAGTLEVSPVFVFPFQHDGEKKATPEQKMLHEMLNNALHDALADERMEFSSSINAKRLLLKEQLTALEWIYTESMDPMKFDWVCEHIGFDSQNIRQKLLEFTVWAPRMMAFLKDGTPLPIPPKLVIRRPAKKVDSRYRATPGELVQPIKKYKTHCPRGHAYQPPRYSTNCTECDRAASRERQRRIRTNLRGAQPLPEYPQPST